MRFLSLHQFFMFQTIAWFMAVKIYPPDFIQPVTPLQKKRGFEKREYL